MITKALTGRRATWMVLAFSRIALVLLSPVTGKLTQPKLNPRQEAHLVELYRQGEHSTAELADLFGVARSTVHRAPT